MPTDHRMRRTQKPAFSRITVALAGISALAVLVVFLAVFGRDWFISRRNVDLSGPWQVSLPAGFVKQMTIESLDDDRYSLKPLNFAGEYELQENRLVMVKPVDPRLTEFVWQLQDDGSLELVEEPPAAKTGARYRGAVLRRTPVKHDGLAR